MEMESSSSSSEVIILYPSPEIGHLVSMVELGKLIQTNHPNSVSVIILVLPTTYENGSIDTYMKTVTATTTLTFHHLPVIPLPPDYSNQFLNLPLEIPELYNKVVYNTLVSILQKSTIKAVILDFFSNAAFQVCKCSLHLPTYYFFTSSTSGLCSFLHIPTLHKTYSKSFKDLDAFINVPGILPIHSSYMPKPLFDRESNSYKNFLKTSNNMVKSCGVIANSFFELEERAARTLRDGKCITDAPTPPIYLIGPLIATTGNNHNENESCLKWLNTQPSESVVLLCFGSFGVFKKQQLKEIAVGLERSGQRFLWVVRKPPSEEDESSGSGTVTEYKDFDLDDVLPQGFIARTRDKGLVVKNWAPQLPILGHESVSGFVSHCGWNSALEAVVSGVPMVAWPLYAEQKLNRLLLVEEIKIALSLKMSPADGFVSAEALEETVRQLMEGEEGRVVRQRILGMSKKAKDAVEDGGSSRVDFLKLTGSWTHE